MRKLKLWNYNKTEYVDLNDERFFATDLKGLGLEYDLAFNESTNGSYLDNLKVKDNDITAKIKFANYKAYDDFRAFVLRNGKQPFILEYTTEKITTTHRIELSQEDIDIDELDDEYFIRVKNVVQKYGLKRDTVKYTTNAMYHEITKDKYAEIVLLEGKTVEQDGELLSVKNPVIESVGRNLFDWDNILRNNPNVSRTTYNGRDCLSWRADSETMNQRFLQGRFKPNTQYTISGYFAVERDYAFLKIYYTDGSINDMRITSTTFTCHTFTTRQGKTVAYLRGSWDSGQSVYLDINTTMLNEGTTPLPYEPFRSTKLAINGEYHQWDKIINDGGVYYDEIGSGKITFDGSEDWWTNINQHNEVTEYYYVFLSKDIGVKYATSEYEIVNAIAPGFEASNRNRVLSKETTDEVFTFDERNDTQVFFRIRIAKERLNGQTIKEYLSQNPLTVVYQLATPTRKPTTYEGGIELFPDSNLFVTDDNNLLDTVELKYKPWNWSNVITKTNLRKYTVGGNDLVIYLPKSYVEHLDGETDEEKIQKYFADKYVEMLLANYIIDNEPIYRDVFISKVSKGELTQYGVLESELVMRPQGAWYRLVELYQEHRDHRVIANFEIKNNSIDLLPVNVRIEFIDFGDLYDIYITSTDTTITFYEVRNIDQDILFIDSYNQKIYLNGLNAYDLLDKNGDSFILVPPGKHELSVELNGEDVHVTVLVTYRQVV